MGDIGFSSVGCG